MEVFILLLGGFLSGAIGSLGVGGGGVLIVFLTFFLNFSRTDAAFMNLIFFIPIAFISIIIYLKQRQIDVKKALTFLIPSLIGSALGVWLSGVIDTSILSKIFGVLLVFISIRTLFSKEKKVKTNNT